MPKIDIQKSREFATEIVRRLRDAGFEALWAGGCVRDHLLGKTPKDYDVATNASPDQVRQVFKQWRTLEMGVSFGVIVILGPREAGQIEVATFRCDATYSDGRHPDHVTFSNAEEDAKRRDFTVNGLFYDPLAEEVVDYVGGKADLASGIIRAIGDPDLRIGEDKLRLLRAVRFAATYAFEIEEATFAAVARRAAEIDCVSAERISEELRRMLGHPQCDHAAELLRQTNLLDAITPELNALTTEKGWEETRKALRFVDQPRFAISLAILLRPIGRVPSTGPNRIASICRRWKLTNDERERILSCHEHEPILRDAVQTPWPRLQRVLIRPRIHDSLTYAAAIAHVHNDDATNIAFCREKLTLPADELNPEPFVSGKDLKEMGFSPGPLFRKVLDQVRDAQLVRTIESRADALQLAETAYREATR